MRTAKALACWLVALAFIGWLMFHWYELPQLGGLAFIVAMIAAPFALLAYFLRKPKRATVR